MMAIPEDFKLRASVMMQDRKLINEQFNRLKSFENPSWSKTWFDISEQYRFLAIDSKNPLQNIRRQCAALAISCYPYIQDNQKEQHYQLLKKTYRYLCELEGYPVEYHYFGYQQNDIPYTLRKSTANNRKGIILMIRGLDSFKEVRYWDENPLLDQGYDIVGIDFPGMGENPCAMTVNSEKLFISLLDDIRLNRGNNVPVIVWGLGFGGYWAQKIASTAPTKLHGAINQGGPIHHGFKPNLKKILFNYSEIKFLSKMIQIALKGKTSTHAFISKLSLAKQNLINKNITPLMYINGDQDKTASNKEFDLLKANDLYTQTCIKGAGHLAIDALDNEVIPIIMDWIQSLESQSQINMAS